MMKRSSTAEKCSPRGLVRVRYGPPESSMLRWVPTGPAQWSLEDPDPKESVRRYIAWLKNIFSSELVARGKDPAQYLHLYFTSSEADRSYFAAEALWHLHDAEDGLSAIGDVDDVESVRKVAYRVMLELLGLASAYHTWTIVDREDVIANREANVAIGKKQGEQSAKLTQPRNIQIARDYQKIKTQNPKLSTNAILRKVCKYIGPESKSARAQALRLGIKILTAAPGRRTDAA